jgi:predicted nucleic acid-binding protein
MAFLLDTNVVSEPGRRDPNATVVMWLEQQTMLEMYLSVVTTGELEQGICRLGNTKKAQNLRKWFDEVIKVNYQGRILPIDSDVMTTWGQLTAETRQRGVTLPAFDALLLATASVYKLTLVTRNVKDMQHADVSLLNPWEL